MTKHSTKRNRADQLSERERKFVELRRKDPSAPTWQIAKAAGYKGEKNVLTFTAKRLLQRPAVNRAIFAPRSAKEEKALQARTVESLSDEDLGKQIRKVWMDLMGSKHVAPSDRIRAATKLGETIRGFFVPLQIDSKQVITLEDLVEGMGGAPPETRRDHDGATQREAEA